MLSAPETAFTLSIMTDMRPGPGCEDWVTHYDQCLEEIRFADSLGFRTVRIPESHGHDDGMAAAPLTVLAAVAAVTNTLRLMTYAIPLALHNPRMIAEQAAVVDLLSSGRLELGVGAGGRTAQFDVFGVSPSTRGRRAENALRALRTALTTGVLHDGKDGQPVPISPRPAQDNLPIYYGGLSSPAVHRAVRMADGCLPYDYIAPERNLPAFYAEKLIPALQHSGRDLSSFFFGVGVVLWATDDPERAWDTTIQPALAYRQQKYLEWSGHEDALEGMTSKALRQGVLVGTPEDLARRLRATHERAPWHDLAFWHRLPGVPHEDAMEHLELTSRRLIPLLGDKGSSGLGAVRG